MKSFDSSLGFSRKICFKESAMKERKNERTF